MFAPFYMGKIFTAPVLAPKTHSPLIPCHLSFPPASRGFPPFANNVLMDFKN